MKLKFFALFGAIVLLMSACKEEGCTNPTATNYNPDADSDDGSCVFASEEEEDDEESNLTDAEQAWADAFAASGNAVVDPGVSATNLIPSNTLTPGEMPTDGFFSMVDYKGAFGDSDWTAGWTKLDGYEPTPGANEISISGTIAIDGETVFWTADNTYILDGFCFVNDGGTLNIAPGTVIKGAPGQNESASALIVANGGQIFAQGTAAQPIVFTYEGDNFDGAATQATRGQWGGLILLGDATLNSNPGQTAIEGIPTSETRGLYGGNNDAHSSGILSYLSIRHGGTNIGAENEINGLTLGGVGSGTIIDHIEVYANADDGVEFFGGTTQTKYLLTAYCGDDSFDYDEGFRGKGQFWCTIQDPNDLDQGDRGGEHDGGTDPETAQPYAIPKIFNATYIGDGTTRVLTFRDNAGGEYHNSIFIDFAKGVDIEDLTDGEDSFSRFENGDLILKNNVFFNIGDGDEAADIFKVTSF